MKKEIVLILEDPVSLFHSSYWQRKGESCRFVVMPTIETVLGLC